MPMFCPFILQDVTPSDHLAPLHFIFDDGSDYLYYEYHDNLTIPRPVQFCKLIGRKRDVFECANVGEWTICPVFIENLKRLSTDQLEQITDARQAYLARKRQ